MSMKEILSKMFGHARRSYDEFGQEVDKKTLQEKLLEKHLERERQKKIRKMLDYYDKKSFKEMTSVRMPYHDKFDRLNKRRKR